MWIMTTVGFFSVVQKEGANHLTVRSRVAADLDQLRARYLPELSPTTATPGNDYRYRATVSHAAFGDAIARIVADVTYSNFKSEVEHVQGLERELVYAKVWTVLHQGLPPLDKPSAAAKTKGRETSQIRWATEHEARGLIGQTTNAKGRARDLAVLAAAIAARGPK